MFILISNHSSFIIKYASEQINTCNETSMFSLDINHKVKYQHLTGANHSSIFVFPSLAHLPPNHAAFSEEIGTHEPDEMSLITAFV